MNRIKSIAVFAACLLLAACSSTSTIQTVQEKKASIPASSSVYLNIAAPDTEAGTNAAQMLRDNLFGTLVSQGIFDKVSNKASQANYTMNINIENINEVSQGARIMLGVFAGSNKMNTNVELVKNSSKERITAFTVTGESASHPLSSENGMDDAIREVTSKIVTALK